MLKEKEHLQLLDALRGVAALIVLWYHCYEGFGYEVAAGSGIYTQPCDHGYLAVDFFFLLSGFVIGYAYDDRWKQGLTFGKFALRRLIRLHPMVIIGTLIGVVAFAIQGCVDWGGNSISGSWIALATVMGMLMLPCWPGFGGDVRANGEMYPLNGPVWSLFFEYIGNILYAVALRRMSTRWLTAVAALSGIALGYITLTQGYLGVGWSFVDNGFVLGLVRMLFPYSLGMVMARHFVGRERHQVNYTRAFVACSLVLVALLSLPFIGQATHPWQNGLFVMVLVAVVFPLIVWTAAHAGTAPNRAAKLLGDISYPLYAVHYPVMYLFYAYIGFPDVKCTMADVWPMGVAAAAVSLVLAYLSLRLYDLPVRRYLLSKMK